MMQIERMDLKEIDERKSMKIDTSWDEVNKQLSKQVEKTNHKYDVIFPEVQQNLSYWLGRENVTELSMKDILKTYKELYNGADENAVRTLKKVHNMKRNPKYYVSNLNQQAGFAAELISTAKENLLAKAEGSEITTHVLDNLDEYKTNHEYVDKVRKDASGKKIERIQSKFVGKDGADCLNKLMSKDYEKYFDRRRVTKLEIPKDFYEQIKENGLLEKKEAYYQKQLEKAKELKKSDVAAQYKAKLDRIEKLKDMLEPSTVTKQEAVYATKHPKRYIAKNFTREVANTRAVKEGITAAALTVSISTVENVQKVMEGKLTPQEAAVDIAKDTGKAGALGVGTEFITTSVTRGMCQSSCKLIESLGKCGVPAAMVSFGVDSYESVVDFATGEIDAKELAYDLGESGARVAGGAAGTMAATTTGAKVGALAGSVVPGAGTAAGAAVGSAVGFGCGVVGGMVGTAITAEAYQSAVELGGKGAEVLADKAQEVADCTVEAAKTEIPNKVNNVREAINTYASENGVPIQV